MGVYALLRVCRICGNIMPFWIYAHIVRPFWYAAKSEHHVNLQGHFIPIYNNAIFADFSDFCIIPLYIYSQILKAVIRVNKRLTDICKAHTKTHKTGHIGAKNPHIVGEFFTVPEYDPGGIENFCIIISGTFFKNIFHRWGDMKIFTSKF